jgi:protein tyrosine phosphatase (PTP) superfamily phosphohydrolase (DUF442 family)
MSLLEAAAGILNASQPLPWLLVAGQPTAEQFAALRDGGLKTVIDLREDMETRSFEEPDVVRALGMTYQNTPVISGALDDATMDRVLAALRDAEGTPTLLHCNSANRTGGPLLALLMLRDGQSPEGATESAMRSGLRSVEVMEWAAEYAERKQAR